MTPTGRGERPGGTERRTPRRIARDVRRRDRRVGGMGRPGSRDADRFAAGASQARAAAGGRRFGAHARALLRPRTGAQPARDGQPPCVADSTYAAMFVLTSPLTSL